MPIRRPVGRPVDIIALELLLSILTALEAGLLLQLGLAGWETPGIGAGQVPGVLAALGLVVLIGWAAWIMDRGGWLLAGANVPVALIAGLLLVAGPAMGPAVVDAPAFLLLLVGAIAGIACGLALPAPSAPRRATDPTGRTAPGTNLTPFGAAIAGRLHRGRAATAGAARAAGSRIPTTRRGADDAVRMEELLPADLRQPQPTGRTSTGAGRPAAGPSARPAAQPARPTAAGPAAAPQAATPRPAAGTPSGAPATRSRFIGDPRSADSFDLPLDAPAPRPRPETARPFISLPDVPAEEPDADPFPVWPPAPVPAPPPAAPRWGVPVSPVDDGDLDDDADVRP